MKNHVGHVQHLDNSISHRYVCLLLILVVSLTTVLSGVLLLFCVQTRREVTVLKSRVDDLENIVHDLGRHFDTQNAWTSEALISSIYVGQSSPVGNASELVLDRLRRNAAPTSEQTSWESAPQKDQRSHTQEPKNRKGDGKSRRRKGKKGKKKGSRDQCVTCPREGVHLLSNLQGQDGALWTQRGTGYDGILYGGWKPRGQNSRKTSFYNLQPSNEILIQEGGFYFIYGQVTYYEGASQVGHVIYINGIKFIQCMDECTSALCTGQAFLRTCNTMGSTYLHPLDRVSIGPLFHGRTISLIEHATFWGLIKLT